jgi:hypothetical protein
MLLGRDMPEILWAEVLNYATWLKNCLPSCATLGKIPYELVNKSKPNLALAHEFSTPVYVHVDTPQAPYPRVDRSWPMVSDAYRTSYAECRRDDSSHTQS